MIPLPSLPTRATFTSASRVVRTLHQALATILVLFPLAVIVVDLPADKTAAVSGFLVAAITGIAKGYNLLFPAEPALDEDPLD